MEFLANLNRFFSFRANTQQIFIKSDIEEYTELVCASQISLNLESCKRYIAQTYLHS
jgi:hypothetical protein